MPRFADYPSSTAPNNGDLLVIKDVVSNSTKNITRENILKGTPLPADTVDTQAIDDGAVTPAKLLAGTGTDWAWKSWTPTLTSMTLGNGTVVAKYAQVGKTVHYRFKFTLGSTSAMSSSPEFSVPVTINSSYTDFLTIGDTAVFDNSASAVYISAATPSTTSKIRMFATGAASTHAVLAGISSTVPMTWATSDILWSAGTYEAA